MEIMIADDQRTLAAAGTDRRDLAAQPGDREGLLCKPGGHRERICHGFWKSGDLGYLDEDGYLFIVDRKKDMIITGGFNVYAIEVEAALSEHPAVLMSAVVGVPHPEWGEAVHAEVILERDKTASAEELIDHVKRSRQLQGAKDDQVRQRTALSSVGKVLRRHVRQPGLGGTGPHGQLTERVIRRPVRRAVQGRRDPAGRSRRP